MVQLTPRHGRPRQTIPDVAIIEAQEVCALRWDWQKNTPDPDASVFALPAGGTKTSMARVVVLNSIAKRINDAQRRNGTDYVFPVRGGRRGRLSTSAWKRAWSRAGLPVDETVLKGVHNLRHTLGRRLRAASVPIETRKLLMGQANGNITTYFSAAVLGELLAAAERVTDRGIAQTPTLNTHRAPCAGCRKSVGSERWIKRRVSGLRVAIADVTLYVS